MAERALATAYVNIVPSTLGFSTALTNQLGGQSLEAGTTAGKKFSAGFGQSFKGLVASFGLTLGAVGLANFTRDVVAAGEAEVISNKRLEQITNSMGLFGDEAGIVSKRLEDLSAVQQMQLGVDDDVIKSTQAKLLTFKNIAQTADEAGGAFDRATMAALDLAAAGFGTAESNAVQLGKALQDPVKGIGALARSGVTFTDTEKERIKTLVESNKVGEAQQIILQAIETQVGGTAEATASSSAKMAQGWAQVQEAIGLLLLPMLDQLSTFLTGTVFPAITGFIDAFKNGQTPLNTFIDAITAIFTFISENWSWIGMLTVAILAGASAWGVWTGAIAIWQGLVKIGIALQAAWNAILAANPIMLVIIAIAALTAALVWFFTQTKIGQQIWADFTKFIGEAIKNIGKWFGDVWNGIKSVFISVFTFIGNAFKGYVNIWIGLLNFIIRGLNSLHVDIPDWVPLVGGQSWGLNIPQIPMLAQGGLVTKPTTAIIGEAGPEVVTPLKDFERMMGTSGGGQTINYYAAPNQSIDSEQALFTAMRRAKVVTGW